ncbi:hypothetical protein PCASD_16688 [Puccinia coronata f. sp. avenae]|uniref:Uncharacterized protein n=1 Tax=Puccinia coronata f. sp. avenae TaxID=200324 RepID=A0A2N5T8D6_9BASI|nr:hypothetical protein PCASD_16688 [Puccinia coronata f. sp. avenae]
MFSVVSSNLNRKRNRVASTEQTQIGPHHPPVLAVRPVHHRKNVPNIMSYYDQQITPPSLCNRTSAQHDDQQLPPNKRRKGVAGAILSTALDAALFTSAIGYAAYQFWTGKRLEEDEEEYSLQLSPKSISTQSSDRQLKNLSSPPPPPYEPRHQPSQHAEPEQQSQQAVRRARLRSFTSRPPTSRLSSSRPSTSLSHTTNTHEPINFILRPTPHPLQFPLPSEPRRTAEQESLMADFVCSLDPYIPPPLDPSLEAEEEEAEGDGDDDAEMRAFKAQIRGLILEGQAALASRPAIPEPSIPPTPGPDQKNVSSGLLCSSSITPAITSSNRTHVDENIRLLQLALDKASSKPQSNWWER